MTDPNGQLPFEGDTHIPIEVLKLKDRFSIKLALETGSQYGSTLRWFKDNFPIGLGCEPNKEFCEIIKSKGIIADNEKSIVFLKRFIELDERILVFIDSHWHGNPCPLKEELEILAEFKQNPIIVIHDFKVPGSEMGYDIHDFPLEYEEIEKYIHKIYSNNFEYHYLSQANGANRGCIFIYPNID